MQIEKLNLSGALLITPGKFGDERGFFSETFKGHIFNAAVPDTVFVQDNHSLSRDVGVLRGLHFQTSPFAQGKLVRVAAGKVLDVIVDIRHGSHTFGKHVSVELSRENWKQLWVPPGFAHAFITLEANTEFLYKVTNYYAPDHDAGIRFDDPALGINWPVAHDKVILSEKDANLPLLADVESPFIYGENC